MSMGLFRTIPVDVDAVQFEGMSNDEPIFKEMGSSIPSWMWKAITRGAITFDSVGLKINGALLQASEWLVHDGVFIEVMTNEKFERTFVPARKPLEKMVSAPKPINMRKGVSEVIDTIPDEPKQYPGASVVSLNPQPETVDEIDSIMNKIGA
jgi:hypothetical protein